jgi:hypothetical protein
MNNVDILIGKLSAFPGHDLCKFYCPTNNTYYYVSGRSIGRITPGTKKLLFHLTPHEEFYHLSYDEVISLILKYTKQGCEVLLRCQSTEFKFNVL